jgi:hypothetical protein
MSTISCVHVSVVLWHNMIGCAKQCKQAVQATSVGLYMCRLS